ncbi:Ig-like domain-containing protein [Biomphalaria pfeifferi]|uniref:Ig-like domain-containing protein n=1 Tax=Biomphalaria pfeifferi TaxID=112525 RepID=A0AAD8EU88_BIOPF|nr:Ig-like domain-containing protein [Biomphalaria pfeifferi]
MISPIVLRVQAQKVSGRAKQNNINMDLQNGLQFRLSEGVEGAENREKQPPAKGDPLSESETGNLLKRIPEIKTQTDDQTDFAKRAGTLPAPKTGEKIPVKFPADDQRNAPNYDYSKQPLEVVRFSPEGEVKLAPDLTVTFSQPMVAVTSQEQASETVPVQLTPQVEGKWRWLGTKTLMFDTKKRFPQATKFTAKIPAGTKSATGQVLQKDFTWTFTTPPPKVETFVPANQITRRDVLMYLSFDQAVNPQEVVKFIKVSGGGKTIPIRLATQEEINKDSGISYYSKQAQPNRWLAFRALNSDGLTENALPGASAISVVVGKGTPSAEGPLTTTAPQSFSFQTFSPFKFAGGYCGWRENKNCSPFESWYLEFNNSIDSTKFAKEMIKIEPAVEGLNIYPSGNYIYITGYKKGSTTYKVTVDGALQDIYGQKLGQPAVANIKVGKAEQNLYAQGGNMVVVDPIAKANFSIFSTNHNSAKVRLYAVQPQNWKQFQEYLRRINYDDSTKKPTIPGRLISDKIVQIASKTDEMVETRIDLSEALNGGFGSVIVDIEPTVKKDKYDRTRIFTWVQATQIGLDAFVDNQELVGWATDLKSGKPLSGVDLSIYPNGKAVAENNPQSEIQSPNSSWWEWLTSWGTSEDSIKEVETVDEKGETTEAETIEQAQTNRTGDNGILRLALPEQSANQPNMLIAKRGKDVAFLPENTDYYWQEGGTWHKQAYSDYLRWFVFNDRGMYRPKEEVTIKGYIRKITAGKFGDVEGLGDSATGFNYKVYDSRNNEIAKGTGNLNAFGAFDFKFKLPDNANLGYSRVDISTASSISGATTSHGFQIQEFRRPEFEVSAKNETEAPYFVKSSANVAVEAKYYAGGGLANADVNWTVRATPTNYTPPNQGDYTFGTWVPWWRSYGGDYYGGNTQVFKGVTDAGGKHVLKIDFESVSPARPYSVSASAAVQDVNRQTWSSTTNLLVHPSSLYVGLKMDRYFVQKGENINLETIVSDIDGKLVAGQDIEIKAVLKDWAFEKGAWKEVTLDEQLCEVKSANEAQKCSFVAKQGGRYTITAKVMDDRERLNETEITIWVAGGKTPPKRNVEQEEVQLIPNKKEFAPNDVAELLVMSPFPNAEGVLTLRRDGIVKTERFSIKDSSIVLKIPLEEKYLPNIYAQVDLVGAANRTNDKGEIDTKLAKRPAFASGNLNLSITTKSRELTVSAEPQDKTLQPGGETKVNVEVKDYRGEPVANSEVAVVVVDESVLALSNYSIANPMSIFYTQRGTGVRDFHIRKDVVLGNPDDVKQTPPPPPPAPAMTERQAGLSSVPTMGGLFKGKAESRSENKMAADMVSDAERDDGNASPDTPINLRQNFDALAHFSASVRTDSNGKAVVNLKLPDNLTRYRITAISVDTSKRFGKSESNITAKQPLMVRPSAPRFMNFGDKIELPIVVQNQTDKDMAVDVAVRATNATLTGGGGKRVVIKANDRAEIRFPVSAEKAGTARFQIAVSSGKFNDAAEISLPVWTPATTEAFATYGTTDQNGAIFQPVQTPGDVFPQFGGLEVTTSSTQLQELTDAFISLQTYPFECSEQVSSRMISVAALQDVLKAFKAKDMPTDEALKKRFARDLEILQSRQNDNGYFGLWRRDNERYKYPFVTVHVAHALVLAKAKGYKGTDEMLNKVKPYLKNVESHYDKWHQSPQIRWTISAYALYVRNLMGDNDAAKAKKLLAEATIEKMPFEALGWLLTVFVDSKNSQTEVSNIMRFLMNRTTETAATANFVTDYGDGAWLIMYSNRRADGVLLEAVLKADPNNDLVPKLVRGLLDHRTKGAWSNTQENVFILLALDKYFQAYEKVTPNFITKVWLGSVYAGEQKFVGRSVDSNLLNIPMNYLVEQGGTSNLILDKQGAGRLYYRIGMKYAPKNLNLKPADYGFEVLRKYEAVDNADDVKQNADGSWTIKSGARVRVRLTMVAQARRYHVALVDNLPAGLEILNPELVVTEEIPADTQSNKRYGNRKPFIRELLLVEPKLV